MNDRNDLHELLLSSTKKVEETVGLNGVLARLWRTILFDLSLNIGRMDHCLNKHIEKARKNTRDPGASEHYNKGNLRRALAKPEMTFKVLVTALRVIGVKRLRMGVELTHEHRDKTLHQVIVDVSDDDLFSEKIQDVTAEEIFPEISNVTVRLEHNGRAATIHEASVEQPQEEVPPLLENKT